MFSAIILAGGSSTRMNGINKQLAVLEGIPVIVRSALAFERSALVDEIILAAPRGEEQDYGALLRSHLVTKLKAVTAGGATRFLSVKNALPKCSCEFIAVHDGARPLISTEDIDRVLTDAANYGASIAAAPVTDTIKICAGNLVDSTPDRDTLYAAPDAAGVPPGAVSFLRGQAWHPGGITHGRQRAAGSLRRGSTHHRSDRLQHESDPSAGSGDSCGGFTEVIMFNILVVDDQAHIRRLYEYTLEKNGYQPFTAGDGAEALRLMENTHIDLVILDLMMPTMDGYTFLRTMRESGSNIPVLIITARDSAADVRKAFTLGTDDFMVKPVDEVEMILRVRALLRRARISEEQRITVGSTTLIYDSFTMVQNGVEVQMPKKEFQILFKLLSFPNKTFTRASLMEEFWDMDSESEARTVDVHINRLRDRLKDNRDIQIVTVRGLGYKAVKTAQKQDTP